MDNRPIGYMDSGVGGLTVVKQALYELPNESIRYLGDTARMPYGPRPASEVVQFAKEVATFLYHENIKLLVVACNTATAEALPQLQAALPIPVVGVIQPGVHAALRETTTNHIGVIATEGTVKANAYYDSLMASNPLAQVTQLAAQPLVELAEHENPRSTKVQHVVNEQLAPLRREPIDTLVLGCTHFPLLAEAIQNAVGPDVTLVNAGAEALTTVTAILKKQKAFHGLNPMVDHHADRYYTTGDPAVFSTIASRWLGVPVMASHLQISEEGLKK